MGCKCCVIAELVVNHLYCRDDQDQKEHDQRRGDKYENGFFVAQNFIHNISFRQMCAVLLLKKTE